MKRVMIVLCTILLIGYTNQQGMNNISIYGNLDAKQTYLKLVDKMDSEVEYV